MANSSIFSEFEPHQAKARQCTALLVGVHWDTPAIKQKMHPGRPFWVRLSTAFDHLLGFKRHV